MPDYGGGGRHGMGSDTSGLGRSRGEMARDRFSGRGGDRRLRGERLRQQMYPGILQGERIPEYRQRMENQRRQAASEAARKAREEAARKAKEDAARRAQQEQQRIAQEAAARQAAQRAAAEEAARRTAEEARQKAEQERLAAIEEQRRKDAEAAAQQRQAAAQQRQAQAQALGTVVTTGPGSLNRPADPLPRYRGYTPMDYDVTKTGSLTDQYARMLNVPFFQPFIAQEDINLAPGATTADSIFGIESLMPTYTFDPVTGLASDPYALQQATPLRQGGRVQKDMGGFIGFMDEPLNIMHPTTKIDVVDDGISSILKKYKEIRSEL
tara:strand:+ start:55 stop:1029 length:975 start_codon:yes stop_codon:yes gene_type:complete